MREYFLNLETHEIKKLIFFGKRAKLNELDIKCLEILEEYDFLIEEKEADDI